MKNFFAFCLLLIGTSAFAQWQDEDRILNQYIVLLQRQVKIEAVLQDYSSVNRYSCLSKRMNIWRLDRNTSAGADDFLSVLRSDKRIKIAQFNHTVEPRALVPNDPFFNQQWNMMNTGQNSGVVGADIEATEAWDIDHSNITINGDTIVVAVIDGNFDLGHEDLNFFVNRNEVPGNTVDDDLNGYIDDVSGWNVADSNGDVHSTGWDANHSTHCAGIVGAIGDNAKGVAGVCWGVKILPVNYGSSDESNVVGAYDYVREMRILYNGTFGTKGAFVVSTNSSFGKDRKHPSDYPIWCAMYDSMGMVGILSAGATANGNWDVDDEGDIPTECPSNWLISVTNTNRNDARNNNAAYGKVNVDLGAPGSTVYSSIPSPINYLPMNGTSMATPHVAGAIAAMYAVACQSLMDAAYLYPDSVALLIRDYLLNSAEWTSAMNNITSTDGRLNLYRAIQNMRRYNCDSCNFDLSIQKIDITCKGANDGAMAALVSGDPANYTFNWSNGLQSAECLSQGPGFYEVTVSDSTGCRRTWTTELHNPDSIVINYINTVSPISGNPGSIIINASAGNDTLMYSMDGVNYQSVAIFSVPDTGLYTVYIKNEEGCVRHSQVLVVISDISDLESEVLNFQLFPNPVNEVLNVSGFLRSTAELKIEVLNVLGQSLQSHNRSLVKGDFKYSINTAALAPGLYYLSFSEGKAHFSKKFVVAR